MSDGMNGRGARVEGKSVPKTSALGFFCAMRSSAFGTSIFTRPNRVVLTLQPAATRSSSTGTPSSVMPRYIPGAARRHRDRGRRDSGTDRFETVNPCQARYHGHSAIDIPQVVTDKWQEITNLLAEIVQVPAALVM